MGETTPGGACALDGTPPVAAPPQACTVSADALPGEDEPDPSRRRHGFAGTCLTSGPRAPIHGDITPSAAPRGPSCSGHGSGSFLLVRTRPVVRTDFSRLVGPRRSPCLRSAGAGRIQRRYGVSIRSALTRRRRPRRFALDRPAGAPSARRHASTTVDQGAASRGVQAAPGRSRGERGFGRRAGYATSYRTAAPGSGGAHRTSCSCRAAEVSQDRLGRQGQHRGSTPPWPRLIWAVETVTGSAGSEDGPGSWSVERRHRARAHQEEPVAG